MLREFSLQPKHTSRQQPTSLLRQNNDRQKENMNPKHSKASIRFRFIAAGTCLGSHTHGGFSSTFKSEFGRGFGTRGEWALSACCEVPPTTSSDDYTLTAGCTYVFK